MTELIDAAAWSARYELLGVIGRGASATVHRARRRSDGAEVAIKELLLAWTVDADAIARDTETFASLRCAGVPRVIERVRVRDRGLEVVYLVLEHVEGVPLDREARDRRYTSAEVFALVAELLEILARLHAHGIVHRDVKPENVVRRPDGRLALIDLGSAVVRRDAPADARFTAAGTIGFAPPEQLAGVAQPANDVYAVGALAVALLTREHPAKLLDDRLQIDWRAHAQLPRAQAKLLDALLSPAAVRPSDAEELAIQARAVASEVARDERPPRRWIAGAVVAILTVMLGAWSASSLFERAPALTSTVPSPPVPPAPVLGPEWRCDREDMDMRFTPLPVGTSRCEEEGTCRDLGERFDELDFDTLCRDEPVGPTDTPSMVVSSERRFATTLGGEAVDCVRHFYAPFGCHITCSHPAAASASQEELTARFDGYLASMRDRYGSEESASVQGVAAYPRRAHHWSTGTDTFELQLDASLCCAPGDQDCGMTQMRTYYARSPWTASR
jgi:serine/threonine protein kinase